MGLEIQVLNANTSRGIDAAFATFVREQPDALFVSNGPFFTSRRVQLANLASRYAVPAIYGVRQFVEVGGLMSYGASLMDAFRQVGVYAGHIIKGTKPADMPASNAGKAIEILESRNDIETIFTDIEMPGSMDGLKLAQAVRYRWPPVNIVITSGKQPRDNDMPKNIGFVAKPYDIKDVLKAFRAFY
jgi:CheY-like chemotaxis protein